MGIAFYCRLVHSVDCRLQGSEKPRSFQFLGLDGRGTT
jgi:hypothetical protein